MAYPVLSPVSTTVAIALPITGTVSNVDITTNPLPFGVYDSSDFKNAAVEQVNYVYHRLGGDVLNVEITEYQVYASYEEACLEYSYLMNIHQGYNTIGSLLGFQTASFDGNGQVLVGDALSGSNIELKYPKIQFMAARKIGNTLASEARIGGDVTFYSASFNIEDEKQDYDLQSIVEESSAEGGVDYAGLVGASGSIKKIVITKVYYKTKAAFWNFYGYHGGVNVVGNLSNYGQYADSTVYEVVPVWQNKLQSIMYKDAISTRLSNFSYTIRNNKLRIFPPPRDSYVQKMWFEFKILKNPWTEEDSDNDTGLSGANNLGTLPFTNIPYSAINSIGKRWIRKYALAICKEMLGYIRRKYSPIPIPGDNATLDGAALITEAQAEMKELKDNFKEDLKEMTYDKLLEREAGMIENVQKIKSGVPRKIYIG
ncbi:hypothetical protein M0R19_04205 [Candidatus Pacearchaeota archaeon]|nr:hypothetical protein [Candidatus Pacearchaeota archaeon]